MNKELVVSKWNYQEAQTKAFNLAGAFFAFSKKKYEENYVAGVEYSSLGSGLICPNINASKLMNDLDAIQAKKIKIDLEENGVKKIIWRELANYECQIINDYSNVVEALEFYGITEKQIALEWQDYFQHCVDNDYF